MRVTQGTFSYLPDFTDEEIEAQLRYALRNGLAIMVEHTDDPHPRNSLWEMWAQPQFDLDEAAASSVEEHLLGCDVCSAVARRVAATAEALRTMVRPVVRPERLAEMFHRGVRILENPIAPGQTCDFHFPKNADLAVHVLGGLALEPGASVEVTLRSLTSGTVLGHVEDAPFDAQRGVVYLACQRGIHGENAQPVEFGQLLFELEPIAAPPAL